MQYIIWDHERRCYMFDEEVFDSHEEIREQLIDFFSADAEEDMSNHTLEQLLGTFNLEIHTRN